MRWDNVYIAGTGTILGKREEVETAVSEGRYDPRERADNDYVAISVAEADEFPPDMAVAAGKIALKAAAVPPDDIGLLLHVTMGHSGLDHFTPAAYVQAKTAVGKANALELKQSSNGGMAALDLAAVYLSSGKTSAALVTTADKFTPPAYDRYSSDLGIVLADGATAAVLSAEQGVARLLSTSLVGDAAHEGTYRGQAAWTNASDPAAWPLDLRSRRMQYLEGKSIFDVVGDLTAGQQEAVQTALDDAGTKAVDIAWFVFPNVGYSTQDWEARKSMGITEERTTWHWGREIGHMGAGDQVAGLDYLLRSGRASAGDRIVLSGVGSGWSFGSAVLEVLR
jgi:3-oxoacyl-[acyl-carrier-protein] synthase III